MVETGGGETVINLIHIHMWSSGYNRMRPRDLKKFLNAYMTSEHITHRAVMVWGPPGLGKTEICRETMAEIGMKQVSGGPILIQYMDNTDLMGIPYLKGNTAEWSRPRIFDMGDGSGKRYWYFDDITQGYPATQNCVSQIVNNFICGVHPVPEDDRYFILTGNDVHHRAHAREMPSHLATRVCHVNLESNVDDWKQWAYKHDIPSEIIGFINFREGLLYKEWDGNRSEKTNPNPRTWEYAARAFQTFRGESRDMLHEVLSGHLTDGVAGEFIGYLDYYEALPDVDAILKEGKMKVDDNPSIQYAICAKLIEEFRKDPNVTPRIFDYMEALKNHPKPKTEFVVILFRDMMLATPRENDLKFRRLAGKRFDECMKSNMDLIS